MKNKTKRYDIALFFIFLIIMLYFLILNSNEQQYYKNLLEQSYNDTAIVDLDIKIYPLFLGKNLSSDNIVPTGSHNLVIVTLLNNGPSKFCQSRLIMRICDPSMNCKDNNQGQNLQNETIPSLKVNEKYSVSFGRYPVDKEGRWKYNVEIESLPPYCNIYFSEKVGEKRDIFEFEAVSLNEYENYKNTIFYAQLGIIISIVLFLLKEIHKLIKKYLKFKSKRRKK